jgi:predicted Zn-dependent peptidase
MYEQTVLKNGLRVVSHPMQQRESVAIGFWVGAGGRFEDDRIKGAAHFLEHILFKGSASFTCQQIKGLIEGVGGSLNAFTSEEETCYYAKVPAKHAKRTFEILCDMVFSPLVAKKDVAKEQAVIIEEIKMYHDLPQYMVLDLLDSLVWPDHPLGKSLAGTPQSVSQMTPRDLRSFHQSYYIPSNIVIALCGHCQHRDFVRLASDTAGEFKGKTDVPPSPGVTHRQVKAKVSFCHRPIEQMHLAIGMMGLCEDHPDKYALSLLNVLLGGNMSSRLFEEVREKRGLAYSIATSNKSLSDTGMFMVRAGVDNHKLVDACGVILKELDRIQERLVTQKEFDRAKEYYLGQVQLALEDTLDHMFWIGEAALMQDYMKTLKEVIREVEKVTPQDIKRVARTIFRQDLCNLAVVGPIAEKEMKPIQALLGASGSDAGGMAQ